MGDIIIFKHVPDVEQFTGIEVNAVKFYELIKHLGKRNFTLLTKGDELHIKSGRNLEGKIANLASGVAFSIEQDLKNID